MRICLFYIIYLSVNIFADWLVLHQIILWIWRKIIGQSNLYETWDMNRKIFFSILIKENFYRIKYSKFYKFLLLKILQKIRLRMEKYVSTYIVYYILHSFISQNRFTKETIYIIWKTNFYRHFNTSFLILK